MTSHRASTRAGLLVAGVALSVTLSACGDDDSATDAGGTTAGDSAAPTSPAATSGSASTEPSGTASPAESSGGTSSTVAVPVYLAGDTPQGPRLFREFHQVPAADPLTEAAGLLVQGAPTDPDYRSLVPGGEISGVTQQDGLIVVTVSGDGLGAGARMDKQTARLAAQSLVYTLQGTSQTRDPVEVRDTDGNPVPLFGIDTAGGLEAAPQLDVLALVNVTSPEQGATVSGTFTAEGVASSFEATVPWEIRTPDGTVAQQGFATAEGWMDKLYPWTTQVDVSGLAPGDYVFAAMTDDPSGGEGGGPTEDTKAITVS